MFYKSIKMSAPSHPPIYSIGWDGGSIRKYKNCWLTYNVPTYLELIWWLWSSIVSLANPKSAILGWKPSSTKMLLRFDISMYDTWMKFFVKICKTPGYAENNVSTLFPSKSPLFFTCQIEAYISKMPLGLKEKYTHIYTSL